MLFISGGPVSKQSFKLGWPLSLHEQSYTILMGVVGESLCTA